MSQIKISDGWPSLASPSNFPAVYRLGLVQGMPCISRLHNTLFLLTQTSLDREDWKTSPYLFSDNL